MSRYTIIFLLACGTLTHTVSSALARNDLEIFAAPTPDTSTPLEFPIGGQYNLVLVEFTAPGSAAQGEDISGGVTLSVRNDGSDPLATPFLVRIILSSTPDDPIPTVANVFWVRVPGLDEGEVWTFAGGAVIPFPAAPGPTYLVAQVDPWNTIEETDESDNSAFLPLTITESPRTLVYYEDFQGGDGGWIPRDLMEQEVYLQHTIYQDEEAEIDRGVWVGMVDGVVPIESQLLRRRSLLADLRRLGQTGVVERHAQGALDLLVQGVVDEEQALLLDHLGAANRIGEMRVAAVDQDVALVEVRNDLFDERVDRLARLDHDHQLARPGEALAQFLDTVAADDVLVLGPAIDEVIDLAGGPVETSDGEALALHVKDEVFSHHCQSHQSNVCLLAHFVCLLVSDHTFPGFRDKFFISVITHPRTPRTRRRPRRRFR